MPGLRRNGTNPATPSNTSQSPWARPRFVLSAGLLGILALAGILLAATHGNNPASRPPPPASHASNPPGAPPASPPGSGHGSASHNDSPAANSTTCSLPPGNQSIPSTSPPADAHWKLVGSMNAPTDPDTYGPQHTRGALRTCFAHNPTGALYATINLYAESTATASPAVERRLLADGPNKALTLRRDANDPPLDVTGPVQVAAYHYTSYSPQSAALTVVLRASSGKLVAVSTTTIWQHSEWRVVAPPGGHAPTTDVQDLAAYTAWAAP